MDNPYIINTGKERFVRREDDILICRPRLQRAVNRLFVADHENIHDSLLNLARHLVVRRADRSFYDYDEVTLARAWGSDWFLNRRMEIEFVAHNGKRQRRAMRLRYLMAVRRAPDPSRKDASEPLGYTWPSWCHTIWDRQGNPPRVQLNFGKWWRVWHDSIPGYVSRRFNDRDDAEAIKTMMMEGDDIPTDCLRRKYR